MFQIKIARQNNNQSKTGKILRWRNWHQYIMFKRSRGGGSRNRLRGG